MLSKGHFIGNTWIQGKGEVFSSSDPYSGALNWEGNSASGYEVDLAVAAAEQAYPMWRELDFSERSAFVERFADLVASNRAWLAETISRETGKPLWESGEEVDSMKAKVAISIEAYRERCKTVERRQGEYRMVTRFMPHGVVGILGPFNLPGHLPNGHMVPALLAGDTVIYKPSKQTPLVGEAVASLWEQADIPSGVVNVIQGGGETGPTLAEHPRLNGLFFTGSFKTGRALHKAFGGRPEKILALEMGGNNPLVAHEVYDLDAAAYFAVLSAYITAGQRCVCARRLIVPEGQEGDAFVSRLLVLIETIRVGAYTETPEPFMGPVISRHAASALTEAQEMMARRGGKILLPMTRIRGSLLTPGIVDVTGVENRPDEEFFGPLLQLIRVRDFDAAIVEAGATKYGLSAGLLSDNERLYDTFRRRIRAGVINWNRQITGASGRQPFGGVGFSGNHRPSGYYAVDYCAYPVASIEYNRLAIPSQRAPGIG